ncbi:MAG TPA: hypothetical protein VHM24_13770 [Gemmatimonadaceae bacterium]|nr:hypothetical protein [Gemmatimonadaceae bacterium]
MSESDFRVALLSDLDLEISANAKRLAHFIADAFGENTAAVLHYGSHLHSGDLRPTSAYDFFVLLDDESEAFRSFTRAVQPRFTAHTAARLSRVLPPSIIGVNTDGEAGAAPIRGKCAVMSVRSFQAACGPSAKDHFTKGRLFQPVRLAWVRDEQNRRIVGKALLDARTGTLSWARPALPPRFTVEQYCRTLLTTSYAGEIRAEKNTRPLEVFEAKREVLVALYSAVLQKLEIDGLLRSESRLYRLASPVSQFERARVELYFRRSKVRAMARWGKSIVLYDRWLDYLREKAERRTGTAIELSQRERRWPLIFLWPKAVRVLTATRR